MSLDKIIGQLEEITEIIEMCNSRYSESVKCDFIVWLEKRKENIKEKIRTELDIMENYYG